MIHFFADGGSGGDALIVITQRESLFRSSLKIYRAQVEDCGNVVNGSNSQSARLDITRNSLWNGAQ